jgi:DNA repair photolyase
MSEQPAQLSILQDEAEAPRLVGIARLATLGEELGEGHNVEYHTIPVRSLLNRCNVPRMPFTWTVNPYRGCEFACKYCYARYTHEFMELRDPLEFERKVFAKDQAAWLLRRDLAKVKAGESIAIGTATDPYQPAERKYGVTRGILEELARHQGHDIGVVTKSTLVLRDIDVLSQIAARNELFVNITITTLNTQLARILEPRAPRPDLRLDALRKLAEAGVPAGVICAPVIPGITDSPGDLDVLVRAVADAGARYVFANALFLKPCSAAVFLPFLEQNFPELVAEYQRRYGTKAYLDDAYRKRISQLFAKLRRKYGIGEEMKQSHAVPAAERKPPASEKPAPSATQIALF